MRKIIIIIPCLVMVRAILRVVTPLANSLVNINKKLVEKAALGVLILLLLSSPSFASDKAVTVQGAWLHTSNSNYGDSAGFNAHLELPVYGDFSVGGEFGYHGPQAHDPYGDLTGYSALGEIIYNVPSTWKLKPYILAGLGWSWWNFDRSEDMASRDIVINTGNAFAQKYAVGADYPLGHDWFLNVEFYYFHADVPKDSFYGSTGAPANVAGDDNRSGRVRIGQEETAVTIGLKKRF